VRGRRPPVGAAASALAGADEQRTLPSVEVEIGHSRAQSSERRSPVVTSGATRAGRARRDRQVPLRVPCGVEQLAELLRSQPVALLPRFGAVRDRERIGTPSRRSPSGENGGGEESGGSTSRRGMSRSRRPQVVDDRFLVEHVPVSSVAPVEKAVDCDAIRDDCALALMRVSSRRAVVADCRARWSRRRPVQEASRAAEAGSEDDERWSIIRRLAASTSAASSAASAARSADRVEVAPLASATCVSARPRSVELPLPSQDREGS